MIRKKSKKTEKKTAKKKVTTKAKKSAPAQKAPAKKKKAEKGKVKIEKKKPTKKPVKKAEKKIKAKKVIEKPKEKVKAKTEVKRAAIPKKVALRPPKVLPPVEAKYPPLPVEGLPEEYGEDNITLMTVDPKRLFTYWEVREDTMAQHIGTLAIRVYDATGIEFNGTNANSFFDIPIKDRIGSRYIDVNPEREYISEVGFINPAGIFVAIARSNKDSTPPAAVESVSPTGLYKAGPPVGY